MAVSTRRRAESAGRSANLKTVTEKRRSSARNAFKAEPSAYLALISLNREIMTVSR